MSMFAKIQRGRQTMPPRVLLYGTEGIGKSTFKRHELRKSFFHLPVVFLPTIIRCIQNRQIPFVFVFYLIPCFIFVHIFIWILPSTNISFFIFGNFFTLASIFNAILLLPIFFFKTSVKGAFPLKYFDPFLSSLECSANLLSTSVVMPVYNLPCLHRIKYKNQLFIFKFLT